MIDFSITFADLFDIADLNDGSKRKLSDYVHHFEPLDYDASEVHDQHHRHKRSLRQDEHKVRIQFSSHGRDFDLELERDHSVFHNNLVVERGEDIGKQTAAYEKCKQIDYAYLKLL